MTATLPEIHQDPSILDRAIKEGLLLEIVSDGVVAARLVPGAIPPEPDFAARARRVWGDQPKGMPLSEIAMQARD